MFKTDQFKNIKSTCVLWHVRRSFCAYWDQMRSNPRSIWKQHIYMKMSRWSVGHLQPPRDLETSWIIIEFIPNFSIRTCTSSDVLSIENNVQTCFSNYCIDYAVNPPQYFLYPCPWTLNCKNFWNSNKTAAMIHGLWVSTRYDLLNKWLLSVVSFTWSYAFTDLHKS